MNFVASTCEGQKSREEVKVTDSCCWVSSVVSFSFQL